MHKDLLFVNVKVTTCNKNYMAMTTNGNLKLNISHPHVNIHKAMWHVIFLELSVWTLNTMVRFSVALQLELRVNCRQHPHWP